MKIAYIAHPISGDIQGNLEKIKQIVRQINIEEPDVVPFAPYYLDCIALDDNNPIERARGIKNDIELMRRGFIDELRLYGDRISLGMLAEINLAKELNIPIEPKSFATADALRKLNGGEVEEPKEQTNIINRVEVIDEKGRSYVNWKPENKVQLSYQDNGRTLKVFITGKK